MEDEQISCELTPELQEQFEFYKEKSNKRFQELEKAINLAAQKIDLLVKRKTSRRSKKVEISAAIMKPGESKAVKLESLQHLKLNFPKFTEGLGVVEWLQDCEHYFSVYGVDDSKRVAVAGMNLQGTARKWFQVYIVGENSMEWLEFCKQFTARFASKQEPLDLHFTQFEEYTDQLKETRPLFRITREEEMSSPENSEPSPEEKSEIISAISEYQIGDSVHHLELRPPKFEGARVFESSRDWEHLVVVEPIYNDDPIYDEDPMEGEECWPEFELILGVLGGDNLHSSCLSQSDLCTSERLEVQWRDKSDEVFEDGDMLKLVDYRGEEKQGVVLEESSIILTSMREIGLEEKSSHLDTQIMTIFDPGVICKKII